MALLTETSITGFAARDKGQIPAVRSNAEAPKANVSCSLVFHGPYRILPRSETSFPAKQIASSMSPIICSESATNIMIQPSSGIAAKNMWYLYALQSPLRTMFLLCHRSTWIVRARVGLIFGNSWQPKFLLCYLTNLLCDKSSFKLNQRAC